MNAREGRWGEGGKREVSGNVEEIKMNNNIYKPERTEVRGGKVGYGNKERKRRKQSSEEGEPLDTTFSGLNCRCGGQKYISERRRT